MDEKLRRLQLVELDILKEFLAICEKHGLRCFALGGTLLGAVRHGGFIPWDDDIDVGMPRPDFIRFEQIAKSELPKHLHFYTYKKDEGYRYYVPRLTDSRVKVIDTSAAVHTQKEAWIDIFPLDGMPANAYVRKMHCFRLLIARMRLNYSMFSTNVDLKKADRPILERLLVGAGRALPVEKLFRTEREFERLDKLMQKYPYDSSQYLINFMGVHKLKEMFHKDRYKEGVLYEFEDIQIRGPVDYEFVLTQMYGDYRNPPSEEEKNHHNTILTESRKSPDSIAQSNKQG